MTKPHAAVSPHLSTACAVFLLTAGGSCLPTQSFAQNQSAAPGGSLREVIVTGTRLANLTQFNSPAPIDVLTNQSLQSTGQSNAFDALNSLEPNFEIPTEGGDISRLVRSARLDGLSPDDTLVLMDGKRVPVSAMINSDVGPVFGSDPVDLDMIPMSLIDHVEVLQQGAAAQYGSDAIAGVINIITRQDRSGGGIYTQEGQYYKGDGFRSSDGGWAGLSLGSDGYLDVALDYRYHAHSNGCGLDPRAATFGIKTNPCQTAGDPQSSIVNFGYTAGNELAWGTLYSVGTYGYRNAIGANGWRTPTKYKSLWYQANFPNGFVPSENLQENDFRETIGLKGKAGAWSWDVSSTYGGDYDRIFNVRDLNSSLITSGGYLLNPLPTHSYAGGYYDTEWTNNIDVNRSVNVGIFATPLNIAFGGEFRRDTWNLNAGSYASSFGAGDSSYPGFSAAEVAEVANARRENKSAYVDLATDPLKDWQVDVAGRFENYTDFGSAAVGKLSTRYSFTSWFALRGTVSTGFRAPTLTQEYQTEVNTTPLAATGQLPATSPAALALGAMPLKPERSRNFSVGIELSPLSRLRMSLDAYLIQVRDQVEDSGLIGAAVQTDPVAYYTAVTALREAGFTIDPSVTQVFAQFYTNGLATRTRGANFSATYEQSGPWGGVLAWALSANVNSVTLTHVSAFANGKTEFTPDVLSEITEDAPKSKVVLQLQYRRGRWSAAVHETRWGRTAEVVADQALGPPHYYTNVITPTYTTDLNVGYNISGEWEIVLGAMNLFDVYPNKSVYQTRDVANANIYPENSPFGFEGGLYYGRLEYRW